MGNNIYSLCGQDNTSKNELENESGIIKSRAGVSTPTPYLDEKVTILQNQYRIYKSKQKLSEQEEEYIRNFDSNLPQSGRYITEQELMEKTNPTVLLTERRLSPLDTADNSDRRTFEKDLPIEFNDGTVYKGSWNFQGKKQGYGMLIKQDGSKYEGFWNNDKIDGKGRYIDCKGNYYEGEWKDGKANGQGTLCVENGSKYEGSWVDDTQEGYGEEVFPDGTSYKGNYSKGQKSGQGKFFWGDGTFYEGEFNESVISGKGTIKWIDGRSYIGEWANNKMNGQGEFNWPDGKRYVGEYRNDKKEGYGTYYWSNEKYYQGNWMNNKQHGEGAYVLKEKTIRGYFRYGKLIQKITDENNNLLVNNGMMNIIERDEKATDVKITGNNSQHVPIAVGDDK